MNCCNFTAKSICYIDSIACKILCNDISIQFASKFPLIQLISTLEPSLESYDFHLSIHAKIIPFGAFDENLHLNLVKVIIFDVPMRKTLYTSYVRYIGSTLT